MNSVVISKIRCDNPNFKGTHQKNKRYAHYIEARDGVDKTVTQGSIENSPLFGKIDNLMGKAENLVEKESQKGKCIYRGILSLREDDAAELGYMDKEKWQIMMKASINQVARKFNIDYKDMQWISAYHIKNGHPHVHWMLWDNSDKIHHPFITVKKQEECREVFEDHILEDVRMNTLIEDMIREDFLKEFASGTHINLKQEAGKYKTQKRNEFLNLNKETLKKIGEELKWEMQYEYGLSRQYVSPYESQIKTEDEKKLASMLLDLKEMLPSGGKLVYRYMPHEIKKKIDKVSRFILERFYVSPIVNQYIKAGKCLNMSKEYLWNDIYKRTGNQILKAMGELLKEERKLLVEEGKILRQKQTMQHQAAQVSYKLLRNVISELYNEQKKSEALEKMKNISNSDSKQAKREAARKMGAVKKPDNE